jgi:lysophospholipase L1-like esterase
MRKIFLYMALCGLPFLILSATGRLPKLFLVGDSIALQYSPYLTKDLAHEYQVERKKNDSLANKNLDIPAGSNTGDSRRALEFFTSKENDPAFAPDLVLLNCGLHDIKRNAADSSLSVSPEEYRSNLERIYKIIHAKGIRLVWINSTPIDDKRHNAKTKSFKRYDADVVKYNAIAEALFARYKVPVIDLYTFTRNLGPNAYIDHAHYNEATREKQAGFITDFLHSHQAILKQK